MCNKISRQIDNYDDEKLLKSCNIPWVCIAGEKDPFYVERNLLCNKTVLIPNAGHYPFFE